MTAARRTTPDADDVDATPETDSASRQSPRLGLSHPTVVPTNFEHDD